MYLLSNALNGTRYGCKIKDPKVDTYYGPPALCGGPKDLHNDSKTTQLINIVELYTSNIKMKFDLVKYWTFNIRHGNKRTRRVQNMTRYNRVNAWN